MADEFLGLKVTITDPHRPGAHFQKPAADLLGDPCAVYSAGTPNPISWNKHRAGIDTSLSVSLDLPAW